MDEQTARARAAQKRKSSPLSKLDTSHPTDFVGFDQLEPPRQRPGRLSKSKTRPPSPSTLRPSTPKWADRSATLAKFRPAENSGTLSTPRKPATPGCISSRTRTPREPGAQVELRVDAPRRAAIQRHHTVTHLLHWALHEVVSPDATQKGSYVGPEKLTFDFSSAALTPAQVADVEKLVNERILENAGVTWTEVPYAEIKGRKDIMQFFGEKYGDIVRVVQIGGRAGGLDGYSMELCGGTHTRATGEIGLFRILSESAVAAGIRRIEAVAGLRAYEKAREETALISSPRRQGQFPRRRTGEEARVAARPAKGHGEATQGHPAKTGRRNRSRAASAKAQTFGSTRPSSKTSALPTAISFKPWPTP